MKPLAEAKRCSRYFQGERKFQFSNFQKPPLKRGKNPAVFYPCHGVNCTPPCHIFTPSTQGFGLRHGTLRCYRVLCALHATKTRRVFYPLYAGLRPAPQRVALLNEFCAHFVLPKHAALFTPAPAQITPLPCHNFLPPPRHKNFPLHALNFTSPFRVKPSKTA